VDSLKTRDMKDNVQATQSLRQLDADPMPFGQYLGCFSTAIHQGAALSNRQRTHAPCRGVLVVGWIVLVILGKPIGQDFVGVSLTFLTRSSVLGAMPWPGQIGQAQISTQCHEMQRARILRLLHSLGLGGTSTYCHMPVTTTSQCAQRLATCTLPYLDTY
jgi:hypothetical protein